MATLPRNKSFSLGVSIGLVPIDSTSDSIASVLSMADAETLYDWVEVGTPVKIQW